MGKNKRTKSYYKQFSKRQKRENSYLGPDMTGFLCMCNGQEKRCVQEAYSILNEFANELYGKEEWKEKDGDKEETTNNEDVNSKAEKNSAEDDSESEEELDIAAAVKADVSQLQEESRKKKSQRRFQQIECGAINCIFIRTTLEDPLKLSMAIMDSILQSQQQRTRNLIRMIPVQKSCKAFPKDIEKTLGTLAQAFLKTEAKKYYLAFKIRNNSSIKRDDLIKPLIDVIQEANPQNSPELKTPDVVVNIEVIKNVCCLSILPGYFDKYSKYNLVEIANKNKQGQAETTIKTDKINTEDTTIKEVDENKDKVDETPKKENNGNCTLETEEKGKEDEISKVEGETNVENKTE